MDIKEILNLGKQKDIITASGIGLNNLHQAGESTDPEEDFSWESVEELPNILTSAHYG